jgi:transposase-like protein
MLHRNGGLMPTAKSRSRVARNFIKRYGPERFAELRNALTRGESGQAIADQFDVSRERVRQWKNTFGRVVTLYQVHPDVQRIIEEFSVEEPEAPGPIDLDIVL